ncbi:MAG: hypothetical protein M1824_001694 [Vezdaea acicularis]|nr:MAG: hypothetical protein M1824_001694 [Vezdaea acicularis]
MTDLGTAVDQEASVVTGSYLPANFQDIEFQKRLRPDSLSTIEDVESDAIQASARQEVTLQGASFWSRSIQFFRLLLKIIKNKRDFDTIITESIIDDIMDLTVYLVEERPLGYPRLGAFLDSDEQWVIYRRFGYLRQRVLLHLQSELVDLEATLEDVDILEAAKRPQNLRSRRAYENLIPLKGPKGSDLLLKIQQKVKEYGILRNLAPNMKTVG